MDVYLGTICSFGFYFAPYSWAQCNGQLQSISQNTALFALLNVQYGGDGKTTFGLPNLQGRAAMGMDLRTGQDGWPLYGLGDAGGTESLAITTQHLPTHNHSVALAVNANSSSVSSGSPVNNYPGNVSRDGDGSNALYDNTATGVMAGVNCSLASAGTNTSQVSFDSRRPFLAINYCIALQGLFPSRY